MLGRGGAGVGLFVLRGGSRELLLLLLGGSESVDGWFTKVVAWE